MDKNEILRRAQQERQDEREVQIRDQSIKWTYVAMILTAAVFAAIRGSQGQPIMDLCATVCISVCTGQAYRYVKTKDGSCLVVAGITLIVAVIAMIRFIRGH